jgi:hypothetical protein
VQLVTGVGRGDDMTGVVSSLVLGGLFIAAGMYYVTSRQSAAAARLRLIQYGQVLPGTILTCSARHETTTEAALGEVTRSYLITAEYCFKTPAGDAVTDRDEHHRPDLRKTELPSAGTPVRVLYLDDGTYALL